MRKLLMVGASALLLASLVFDEASAQRRGGGASRATVGDGAWQDDAAWAGSRTAPGWGWGFPVAAGAVAASNYGSCWYWNPFTGTWVNACSPYCYGYGPCW